MINLPALSAPRGVAGTIVPLRQLHLLRKLWLHLNHTELIINIAMFRHYISFPTARHRLSRLGRAPGCRPAPRFSNGVGCRVVEAAYRRSPSRALENSSSASRWLVLPSIVPLRGIGRVCSSSVLQLELSVCEARRRGRWSARSGKVISYTG